MDELPGELLHEIFVNLPIIQKHECMRVCSRWNQVISTYSLFHAITCKDKTTTEKWMDFVKEKPYLGLQVKKLVLTENTTSDYSGVQLLQLFPRLREINLQGTRFPQIRNAENEEGEEISASLPNHIESIDESGSCRVTSTLITFGLCSRLATLSLYFQGLSSDDFDTFCRKLTNMPVLKHLDIASDDLTINHLEMIHTNIPSLTSLALRNIEQDTPPDMNVITPATNITKLMIEMERFTNERQDLWLGYIKQKYPALEHFDFVNADPDVTMEQHNYFFQNRLPTIMQESQITALNLADIVEDASLFRTLDQFGCKLQQLGMREATLEVMDVLAQSNQAKTIRTLYTNIEEPFSTLSCFKAFKSLESLTFGILSFENKDNPLIMASDFFDFFPETVTSLEIAGACIEFNETDKVIPSIQKLELRYLDFYVGMDTFITKNMPNVRSLIVAKERNPTRDVFMFPYHHFDYLEIMYTDTFIESPHSGVLLSTMKDATHRYYDCYRPRRGQLSLDTFVAPSEKPADIDSTNVLQIICGSTKRLLFGDGIEAHLTWGDTAL